MDKESQLAVRSMCMGRKTQISVTAREEAVSRSAGHGRARLSDTFKMAITRTAYMAKTRKASLAQSSRTKLLRSRKKRSEINKTTELRSLVSPFVSSRTPPVEAIA